MKRLLLFSAATVMALLLRLPFEKSDVGQLQPVEVIRIIRQDGRIMAETDTGDFGIGESLGDAFADLKATTAGEIFLDTADYLLIKEDGRDLLPEIVDFLRPGCAVFLETEQLDLTEVGEYLANRDVTLTLRQYQAGVGDIPQLKLKEGRLYVE